MEGGYEGIYIKVNGEHRDNGEQVYMQVSGLFYCYHFNLFLYRYIVIISAVKPIRGVTFQTVKFGTGTVEFGTNRSNLVRIGPVKYILIRVGTVYSSYFTGWFSTLVPDCFLPC